MPFDGPWVPFGATVEYHPISAKDQSRLRQFGPKVLPGTFLGYALYAGGIWKGDVMVADIEELQQMDASELHARRVNAKEVLTRLKGEKFIFPIADETVKLSGGDQVLRTSTLIRDHPDRQKGLLQPHDKTHHGMMVKPKATFWFTSGDFIYRHHVEPRVKLNMRLENHSLFH